MWLVRLPFVSPSSLAASDARRRDIAALLTNRQQAGHSGDVSASLFGPPLPLEYPG